MIGAIALSWALGLKEHVHVLGAVPSGLPHIGLPEVKWSWDLIGKLVPTAFAMFVVILAQSAATSRAYAARYNERFSEKPTWSVWGWPISAPACPAPLSSMAARPRHR